MIQHYVGQLSDSYMGLVYISHLKPHFVRRGGLELGVNGTSHRSCFCSMTGVDCVVGIKLVLLFWCLYGKASKQPLLSGGAL